MLKYVHLACIIIVYVVSTTTEQNDTSTTVPDCPGFVNGSEACVCANREAFCIAAVGGIGDRKRASPPLFGHYIDDVTYTGYDVDSAVMSSWLRWSTRIVVKNADYVTLDKTVETRQLAPQRLLRLTFIDCGNVTILDHALEGVVLASLEFYNIDRLNFSLKAFDYFGVRRILKIENTAISSVIIPRQFR